MNRHALIIDDDRDFSHLLAKYLQSKGLQLSLASSGTEGLNIIKKNEPDLVLLDVILPDTSGVDLVGTIKSTTEDLPVLMVSSHGNTNIVVNAMKAGASDYIQKPIVHNELWEKITALLEMRSARETERALSRSENDGTLIGNSLKTRQLLREIIRLANADAPLLIRGDRGTGKNLISEIVHFHSHRQSRPFVRVNCAALAPHTMEAHLFGYERGAFPGALREKAGQVDLAEKGTLFLDEIGALSLEMQARLLRLLQGQEFERMGGTKTIKSNVRIMASSNRNLEKEMAEHRFREDLFYRLNVLTIYVPTLKERKEDIPLLVQHFFRYYCNKLGRNFELLSPQIMEMLSHHDWPGNILQLKQTLEQALILGHEPVLSISDFSPHPNFLGSSTPESTIDSLRDLEKRTLLKTLEQTGGNISRAAKILAIGRDTVYRRLRKYNIELKNTKFID